MIRILRDADWLNADRAGSYMLVLGVALIVFMLGAFGNILKPALTDPQARPMAADFDAFWSGARLALHGQAAQAYDGAAIGQAEAVGAQLPQDKILPYLYPPVFLLLCLPLAAFPYLVAMPLFLGLGFVGNALQLRVLLPQRWAALPIWVLPGAVMNAVIGQNGFVSAAAFGGAMLLLESRPIAAGACLGLFAYKPHLALCIPLALAAARRFAAFLACAASAALLASASWLILGIGAWREFFAHAHVLRAVLASPEVWPKLVSVYAAIRLLHGGTGLAFAGQLIVSVVCLAAVAYVCAGRPGGRAEMATLIVAALLCTPYAMDYDLVCLGLPMAWLAGEAMRDGWRPWEKLALLACFVVPLFARGVNLGFGVPLAPFCLAGLLGCVVSRARARGLSALVVAA
jgi:hypothetical protein